MEKKDSTTNTNIIKHNNNIRYRETNISLMLLAL